MYAPCPYPPSLLSTKGSKKDLKDFQKKDLKANRSSPKAKMLYLQSFLRKGVSLGHVGRKQNLKELKDELFSVSCVPAALILGSHLEVLLRIFSTEGRGDRLCWALSNPQGPEACHISEFHPQCFTAKSVLR